MSLTKNDLTNLKASIRQDKVQNTLFNIKEQEYIDDSNILKIRTIVEQQKPGNKHPVNRLLDFDLMVKASFEENEKIADYFADKFIKLESNDKLDHEDKEILSALVFRGILTYFQLAKYELTKLNLLLDSYCNEKVYRKVKIALPALLKTAKEKHKVTKEEHKVEQDLLKANKAKQEILDKKLKELEVKEKELDAKLAKANKATTQASSNNNNNN